MKLAWIGAGIMGCHMVRHLALHDNPVILHSRTRRPEHEELINHHFCTVRWANTPAEAVLEAEVVFMMAGYPIDLSGILFSSHGVVNAPARPKGQIWVDMSTNLPEFSREIYLEALALDCEALDAPVTGGEKGAREGKLEIMVGGSEKAFHACEKLFQTLGSATYFGPTGSGQQAKLANQLAIAGNILGVVEAIYFGRRAGLDLNKLLDVISRGSGASWASQNLGPKILSRDFTPGFMVDHFVKDLNMVAGECLSGGFELPGGKLILDLYQRLQKLEKGKCGIQALTQVIEAMNL